jgi:hypothetical protein
MVVSRGAKRRADPKLDAWSKRQLASAMYISVITLGEIAKGIALLPPGEKRERLMHWASTTLQNAFAGRILDIDRAVALRWGREIARLRQSPPAADALIAATALEHGLTIVTRNVRDFAPFNVAVENPWR